MAEKSKIPCNVCVTQDVCRSRGECVQADAWTEPTGEEIDRACHWFAFVIELSDRFKIERELAHEIATVAQEHFAPAEEAHAH